MTAGTWTITNQGLKDLINGTFDVDAAGVYTCILVASTSNISASSTTMAAVTGELATANGYTAGGIGIALTITGTSPYQISFVSNPVWTASGGSIVARWAVVGKIGGDVMGFVLLDNTPADVTVTNGNQLQIDADGSPQPFFTLSKTP